MRIWGLGFVVACHAGTPGSPDHPPASAGLPSVKEPPCAEPVTTTELTPAVDGRLTVSRCPGRAPHALAYVTWSSEDGRTAWTRLDPYGAFPVFDGTRLIWTAWREREPASRVLEATYRGEGRFELTHEGPWFEPPGNSGGSMEGLRRGDVLAAVQNHGVLVLDYHRAPAQALAEAGEPQRAADLLLGIQFALVHAPDDQVDRVVHELNDERVLQIVSEHPTRHRDQTPSPEWVADARRRFETAVAADRWLEAVGAAYVAFDRTREPSWRRGMVREIEARLRSGGNIRAAMDFFGGLPGLREPDLVEIVRPAVVALAERGVPWVVERPETLFDVTSPEGAIAVAHLRPSVARLANALARSGVEGGIPARLVELGGQVCVDFLAGYPQLDDIPPQGAYRRWCGDEPRSRRLTRAMPDSWLAGCPVQVPARPAFDDPRCAGRQAGPCAADDEGHLRCPSWSQSAPDVRFLRFDAATDQACAWAGEDGTMRCWGDRPSGVPDVVPDVLHALVRDRFVCALRWTGQLTCWGDAPPTPSLEVPGWVHRTEAESASNRLTAWLAPDPTSPDCELRSRGPYDGGELFEVHCVQWSGPPLETHEITARWVGPDGAITPSPLGMRWTASTFSTFELTPGGVRWVETNELGEDGRPVDSSGQVAGEPASRVGFVPYVGHGEFGAPRVGPWEPSGRPR